MYNPNIIISSFKEQPRDFDFEKIIIENEKKIDKLVKEKKYIPSFDEIREHIKYINNHPSFKYELDLLLNRIDPRDLKFENDFKKKYSDFPKNPFRQFEFNKEEKKYIKTHKSFYKELKEEKL